MPRANSIAPSIVACFACLSLFAVGCSSTTTTTPTAPAAVSTTTESFSGTFGQQGSSANPFTVSATGPVQIELSTLTPLGTMAVGVSVNSWDGSTCGAVIAQNSDARSRSEEHTSELQSRRDLV